MSAAPAAAPAASLREHRSHQRYPLQLEMEYKLLSRGRSWRTGSGATLNISSGGVLFTSDASVPSGSQIELTMRWPFLLEGVCPLRLVMRGHVVRSRGNVVAISSRHHEFRTAGTRMPKSPKPSNRVRSLA
jgi:hypothetical protein